MAIIYREDFETDGNGVRYFTSIPEFTDFFGDFFTRTDGSNIGPIYSVTGVSGTSWFAAMDTNGEPGGDTVATLTIPGIDISGMANLAFEGLFAEDDDGTNQDWDADALVYVEVRIDGGAWTKVLQFASQGATNTEPGLDTDFDGIADGPALTDSFALFGGAIAGTGTTLDMRVTFENLEAGDEDISIDDLTITGTAAGPVTVLDETFDDASKFMASAGFFSDGSGDYFGISDGVGGGDFGGGTPPSGLKPYSGTTGSFLTGMDLDGEGASVPIMVTWSGLDISGLSNLQFQGDFGEFFDSPGDIDASDFIRVVASIDGGPAQTLLDFRGADFSSGSFNGVFREDTDGDGVGDGAALGDMLATFLSDISGTGTTLDLTLELSLQAGDEDFAVDNFKVIGTGGGGATPAVIARTGDGLDVDEAGSRVDSFTLELATVPASGVAVAVSAPDGQTLVSLDGVTFAASVDVTLGDTGPVEIFVRAVDDAVDEQTPHAGDLTFAVTSADPAYDGLMVNPLSVSIEDNDFTVKLISEIQGNGAASALVGQEVTVEAIVTGTITSASGVTGFFLQEEDADQDGDAATSEGIFVFLPGATVSVGDRIRLTGEVEEFNGLTEIGNVSEITTLATGEPLPSVTQITLGMGPDFEAVEGMRVELVTGGNDPLTVITNFNLDRFGEVTVAEGNQVQPTQVFDPATQQAEIDALMQANLANRLTIDDGSTAQNPDIYRLIDSGDGTPLEAGDPITANGPTLRLGTEITSVTGIMDERFGGYRIQSDGPLETVPGSNDRPQEAPDVGGELKVASFNVLNYFTTLDQGSNATGPNGDLDPRGADTASEFARQTEKIVAALAELDADIVGLQELENNGFGPGSAVAALVDALNAHLGAEVYAYVDPGTGFAGTDAITTGLIYKQDVVSVTGEALLVFDEASSDATLAAAEALYPYVPTSAEIGDFQRNRPAMAATFVDADGSEITVAVNHFKSKGSSGLDSLANAALAGGAPQVLIDALLADPNYDQGDGQGFWNAVRTDAALELAAWLDGNPTGAGDPGSLLVLGDLNAYAMEDPVKALVAGGFTDLAQAFIGPSAYSFVFDGMRGTLDYGLASGGLLDNITGVAEWHINADEPDLLNYDESFKNPAFYNGDVFAASDHDPFVVGLTLDDPTVTAKVDFGASSKFKRGVTYSEDGMVVEVRNLPEKIPEVSLAAAGIVIGAEDHLDPSPDFVGATGAGIGVVSQAGDNPGEPARLDDGETLTFTLEAARGLGDALDVEFVFNDVSGGGQVALEFFEDGVLVESAVYDASGGSVSHDLALDTSFDSVSITALDDTSLELASAAFGRLMEPDAMLFG